MNQVHTSRRSIALMDCQPLTRFGLEVLINSTGIDYDIRLEESCLEKLSEALNYQPVDWLVTDLQSAEQNIDQGLEILLSLSAQFPQMKIIVYTSCHNSHRLRKLLNIKNINVIARGETLYDTEDYFRQVFNQRLVISPKIASAIACDDKNTLISKLTRCELYVLNCLFNGFALQQIADIKKLSIKTISGQKCSAMRKLKVGSDAELFMMLNTLFN